MQATKKSTAWDRVKSAIESGLCLFGGVFLAVLIQAVLGSVQP